MLGRIVRLRHCARATILQGPMCLCVPMHDSLPVTRVGARGGSLPPRGAGTPSCQTRLLLTAGSWAAMQATPLGFQPRVSRTAGRYIGMACNREEAHSHLPAQPEVAHHHSAFSCLLAAASICGAPTPGWTAARPSTLHLTLCILDLSTTPQPLRHTYGGEYMARALISKIFLCSKAGAQMQAWLGRGPGRDQAGLHLLQSLLLL